MQDVETWVIVFLKQFLYYIGALRCLGLSLLRSWGSSWSIGCWGRGSGGGWCVGGGCWGSSRGGSGGSGSCLGSNTVGDSVEIASSGVCELSSTAKEREKVRRGE